MRSWSQAFILFWTLVSPALWAYDPKDKVLLAETTPAELQGIGIEEHLGSAIDRNLVFKDEAGKDVTLGEYFRSPIPVILSVVYYDCPSLCNYHLNGLTAALKQIKWTTGQQYQLVAVSMDAKEGPSLAGPKRAAYLKEYGRPNAESGWHFLTGSEENIRKLTGQVGFKFRWDESQKQFAHASAATIVTPDGVISRYLYGIEFDPNTIRLALLEASQGKIGTLVDQLILFCFHFDPAKNKYTLYAYNIMRAGAILIVVALSFILIPAWRRERKKINRPLEGEG